MARHARILVVLVLVVLAASAAAAQGLLTGGSPGLSGSGSAVAQSPSPGSSPGATTPGTTTPGTTTPGTPSPSTGTPTQPAPTTPTPAPAAPSTTGGGGMAVDQIVSLTRVVDAGAPPVSAFTVPAGRLLVITDVLITNTGSAPACGASISSSAAPTAGGESGTGLLCVPAQSSLNLGLTTGLEFSAGQAVVLANAPTSGTTTAGGALHYHLRGFLAVASSGA
jgi:hypothetical protein